MTNILVFMTTATKREEQKIAQNLLGKRLIACANIYGPVESHFWWQNKIEKAGEFLAPRFSPHQLLRVFNLT